MDFANYRMGINTESPSEALTINGNVLVVNGHVLTSGNLTHNIGSVTNWWNTIYVDNITAENYVGTLSTNAQPNITSVGTLTGLAINGNLSISHDIYPTANITSNIGELNSWFAHVYANVINSTNIYGTIISNTQPYITKMGNVAFDSISIVGDFEIGGNSVVENFYANYLYEQNHRVLTEVSNIQITGDVVGYGTYSNVAVTLKDSGVVPGVYGAGDDEYADRIPKITVNKQGIITSIANVTLTQVGNVSFDNTTMSTQSDMTIRSYNNGNIYINADGTGTVQFIGADGIRVPTGTTAERPYPVGLPKGYIRFNTDTGSLEWWNGTDWGGTAAANMTSQVIIPDGINDTFNLSSKASTQGILVNVNGVMQRPAVAYNVINENQIQFTQTPEATDVIEIRQIAFGVGSVQSIVAGNLSIALESSLINFTGNIAPTVDSLYSLSTDVRRWNNLYLRNIGLGNVTLNGDSGVLLVRDNTGLIPAKIQAANPTTSQDVVTLAYLNTQLQAAEALIQQDDSRIQVIDDGVHLGNIQVTVNNANVVNFGSNVIAFSANTRFTNVSMSTPLPVSSGGTGAKNGSDALDNLLPVGRTPGYVLTTAGTGSYYWSPGGSGGGGGGSTQGTKLFTSRVTYVADPGQTLFENVGEYVPGSGQLRVYINGVRQFEDAYDETSNTSFTLSESIHSGTVVMAEVDGYVEYPIIASNIAFTPTGYISANTVQLALQELDSDKAAILGATFLGNIYAPYVGGTIINENQSAIRTVGNLQQLSVGGTVETTGLVYANAGVESYSTTSGALRVIGGAAITGNLNVGGNLSITGNFTVGGTFTTVSSSSLSVTDPYVNLATSNPNDLIDIGLVGRYSTAGTKYTGLIRDHNDKVWKFFSAPTNAPTTSVVDLTGATYDVIRVGNVVTGNVLSTGNITTQSNVIATFYTGNVISPYQPYITGTGNLITTYFSGTIRPTSNVSVNIGSSGTTNYYWGNVYAGNVITPGIFVGNITSTGGSATGYTGLILTASQPNITSHGNLTSLSASGTVETIGIMYANSGIAATSTSTGALQLPNFGGIGVAGNVHVGGNVVVPRAIIGGGVVRIGLASTSTIDTNGGAAGLTLSTNNITAGVYINLNSNVSIAGTENVISGHLTPTVNNTYSLGASGAVYKEVRATDLYGTVKTAAQGSITSLGTLTGLTVQGTLTSYNINPASTGTYAIGGSGAKFTDGYFTTLYGQVADSKQDSITQLTKLGLNTAATATAGELTATGSIYAGLTGSGQFSAIAGSGSAWYNSMLRNDGSTTYFLTSDVKTTSALAYSASWSTLRPFQWNNATGAVTIDGTGVGVITGGKLSDGKGDVRSAPQTTQNGSSSYSLVASDNGKHVYITGTAGVTVPSGTFSAGDMIMIVNGTAASRTIDTSAVTCYLAGTSTTTSPRTLAQRGVATLLCVAANTFHISGAGLS
jgi:hypothetical protein